MSLLSALYTGVSGLQTFGESLQVIGDNIANVNTTAFKSSRAEFSDMLNQSINGSGKGNMGRGVRLNAITTSFQQGSFSNTDRLTDLAISGNGFFVVNDGNRDYYTRNGQFTLNSSGEIVTQHGYNVMGYTYDDTGTPTGTQGPMSIGRTSSPPQATGNGSTAGSGVELHLNLDSRASAVTFDIADPANTSNFSTSITVYDSLGTGHPMMVYFNKTADNTWDWHATVDGAELQDGTPAPVPGAPWEGGTGTMTFNADGSLEDITGTTAVFNFTGSDQTVGFDFGSTIAGGGTGLDGTTQFAQATAVNSQSQDGFPAGSLASIDIDADGIISGIYSNGRTIPIGQLTLANFSNLQGLLKVDSGLYTNTTDSGLAVIGTPNQGGYGSVSSFSLELSNVDLATEFVELIKTQRAYQANSKIITTGDQLLNEVVNILR